MIVVTILNIFINIFEKVPTLFICECGKKYNYLSGLSRHRKSCKGEKNENIIIHNKKISNEVFSI